MPPVRAEPTKIRARWVVPVSRPPIANGVVTVAGGRVVAVGGDKGDVSAHDLGDVILLPGLVNAHTHLEFSDLAQPLGEPRMPFAAWIGRVVEHRRKQAAAVAGDEAILAEQRAAAIAAGLAESAAAGVVAVGEIASGPWPGVLSPEHTSAVDGVIFQELLGLAGDRQESIIAAAREHLDSSPPGDWDLGLSPHAPYTVPPELVARACQLSSESQTPVAMHLAESLAELELLASHSGELVELLRSLEAWHPAAIPRGIEPADYLTMLAAAHRALVIHGNFLTPRDWRNLAERRKSMSVVYCPRTFAYFGHGRYPLAEMLAAGVRVAVGTDSRASNPDLSVLAELRQVARVHPEVSPESILAMGTLLSAEALGVEEDFGSIEPDKLARFATVPVGPVISDPVEWLLRGTGASASPCHFP
jgi:cytosine/adenosine deaminase-related metal-dependent hydrolase